jgi:hypothetical protein
MMLFNSMSAIRESLEEKINDLNSPAVKCYLQELLNHIARDHNPLELSYFRALLSGNVADFTLTENIETITNNLGKTFFEYLLRELENNSNPINLNKKLFSLIAEMNCALYIKFVGGRDFTKLVSPMDLKVSIDKEYWSIQVKKLLSEDWNRNNILDLYIGSSFLAQNGVLQKYEIKPPNFDAVSLNDNELNLLARFIRMGLSELLEKPSAKEFKYNKNSIVLKAKSVKGTYRQYTSAIFVDCSFCNNSGKKPLSLKFIPKAPGPSFGPVDPLDKNDSFNFSSVKKKINEKISKFKESDHSILWIELSLHLKHKSMLGSGNLELQNLINLKQFPIALLLQIRFATRDGSARVMLNKSAESIPWLVRVRKNIEKEKL